MAIAKAVELVLKMALEFGDWLVFLVFPVLLHDSASPLNDLFPLLFEQGFTCDVVYVVVAEPCANLFDCQFAWWFALGLAVFAHLAVGDVVRCYVGITQHCSALSKREASFKLVGGFELFALDALLLSYFGHHFLLCLGELLPFRAGFGRNVHHLKCTCPFGCRPVRHIVPNKTGRVSHMYTKNKELLN